MPPAENPIYRFTGKYFEVCVWRLPALMEFETLIRARPDHGPWFAKGVIGCSADHLQELSTLSKIAQALIEHLMRGLPFAAWTHDLTVN